MQSICKSGVSLGKLCWNNLSTSSQELFYKHSVISPFTAIIPQLPVNNSNIIIIVCSGRTSNKNDPAADNTVWMMGNPNWGTINLHLGEVSIYCSLFFSQLSPSIQSGVAPPSQEVEGVVTNAYILQFEFRA